MSQGPVSLSILSVPSPVDCLRHQAPSGLEHGSFVECLDRMLGLPALAVQPVTTVHVLETSCVTYQAFPPTPGQMGGGNQGHEGRTPHGS